MDCILSMQALVTTVGSSESPWLGKQHFPQLKGPLAGRGFPRSPQHKNQYSEEGQGKFYPSVPGRGSAQPSTCTPTLQGWASGQSFCPWEDWKMESVKQHERTHWWGSTAVKAAKEATDCFSFQTVILNTTPTKAMDLAKGW